MIAIFSDTHADEGHGLAGEALAAAREASIVIHAGDFTTEPALEAFHEECGRLYAVHGNADDPAVRDRLPATRRVEAEGLSIAVTHRRDGGTTGLALFGRSRDADLVVSGHTHRPTVTGTDEVTLLDPGSHADPRGNRPGFATLSTAAGTVRGRLLEPDGSVVERFDLEARS